MTTYIQAGLTLAAGAFISLLILATSFVSSAQAQVYGPAYNPYGGTTSVQSVAPYAAGSGEDARCPSIAQNLFRGLRDVYQGGDIYRLQTFLMAQGYLDASSATGYFGGMTASALARYQAANNIYPVTGGLGPVTRRHISARCSGTVVSPVSCPAIPMAYPLCQNGVQPVQSKDYRGCVTGYTCPTTTGDYVPPTSCRTWNDGCNTCSRTTPGGVGACTLMYCAVKQTGYCSSYFDGTTGYGTTPTISSFSGPTTLGIAQMGTWSVTASDPQNQQLTYSIVWGDEGTYNTYTLAAPGYLSSTYSQNTTFTHTYSTPGTYTVRITARNAAGYTATGTATVVVTTTSTGTSNIRVTQPNTYVQYYTGNTLPITWTDSNTYIVAPRYDIYLRSYMPLCSGYICPMVSTASSLYPQYSYTVGTSVYGNNYSWNIPSTIPNGNYVVEVCSSGSSTSYYPYTYTTGCDQSDTYFTIGYGSGSTAYPYASMTLNPTSSSAAPLTTTASVALTLDPSAVSVCGTQTYGTLEWGDGYTDTVTYLGCSGSSVTVPLSHTYTSGGTYTARLMRNSAVQTQATVYVGTNTTTSGYISSVTVNQSSVQRGGALSTSWVVSGAPSNSSVGLELVDANSGSSYGYIALGQTATSGSYTWTVPTYTTATVADTPYVQGSSQIDGKNVYVRARLYTPSNACFGYCASTSQPTFISSTNSGTVTIGNGTTTTSVNPTFTVSTIGNRTVTVTTYTPISGTTCGANGTLVLDYNDGTSTSISTTFSGSNTCSNETRTFTYQYATTGSKTITIRNNTYPYQIYTSQTVNVN